jgi:hypothetical protein
VLEQGSLVVMPGLVPGIHVWLQDRKTWMAGTKPGHDGIATDSNVKHPGSAKKSSLRAQRSNPFRRAKKEWIASLRSQ